jgi:hypothetical protein
MRKNKNYFYIVLDFYNSPKTILNADLEHFTFLELNKQQKIYLNILK